MTDFNATINQINIGHNSFDKGTTNDEHTTLYGWNSLSNLISSVWIDYTTNTVNSKIYKNKNKQCTPNALYGYGNLIYYDKKLFKFGGGYPKLSNEFFVFDLTQSMWKKLHLKGKEIPNARRYHQIIKYKQYAILFGSEKSYTYESYDMWLIDLWFDSNNACHCTKLLDSKIMSMDGITFFQGESRVQLVNNDILIFKPQCKEFIYWIDLSLLLKDKRYNEYDWNKAMINNIDQFDCIGSNNDCFIVFPCDSIANQSFSMSLFINEKQSENYQINFKLASYQRYKHIENVSNVQNDTGNSSNAIPRYLRICYWLNNTYGLYGLVVKD